MSAGGALQGFALIGRVFGGASFPATLHHSSSIYQELLFLGNPALGWALLCTRTARGSVFSSSVREDIARCTRAVRRLATAPALATAGTTPVLAVPRGRGHYDPAAIDGPGAPCSTRAPRLPRATCWKKTARAINLGDRRVVRRFVLTRGTYAASEEAAFMIRLVTTPSALVAWLDSRWPASGPTVPLGVR